MFAVNARAWYVSAGCHTCVGYDKDTKRYAGGDSEMRDLYLASSFETAWSWLVSNHEDYFEKLRTFEHRNGDMSGLFCGLSFKIHSVELDSAHQVGDEHWYDAMLIEHVDLEDLFDEDYDHFLNFRPIIMTGSPEDF